MSENLHVGRNVCRKNGLQSTVNFKTSYLRTSIKKLDKIASIRKVTIIRRQITANIQKLDISGTSFTFDSILELNSRNSTISNDRVVNILSPLITD